MSSTRACRRSTRHRLAPLVLAVGLLLPPSAAAGQLAELQPGARVRIRAPDAVAGRLDGTVLSRGPDGITVSTPGGAPLRVPLAAITAAEVGRGRSRRAGTLRGAAWGAGVGAAVGLLGALDDDHGCAAERCEDDYSAGEYVAAGAFGGASIGGVVGVIVGAERWQRLHVPARPSLSLCPRGRTVVGAIAVRF